MIDSVINIIISFFKIVFDNKEWVFSGIGVTIFVWIVGKLCGNCKRHKTREDYANKTVIKQIDKGTSNTQIGIQNNNYTGKRGSDE